MSRVLPYGERALLVEVDDSAAAVTLAATLTALFATRTTAAGVREVVPGARTVLVQAATAAEFSGVRAAVQAALARPRTGHQASTSGGQVDLRIRYDGADLAAVADELGLSVAEVVRRHAAASYTVAFCGFAPGFAYLTGLPASLQVARLDEPRTAVPPGSVGIAGEFTGVYPRSSPGGWRLLGSTDAQLWDTNRAAPGLLAPGTTVRFVAA